MGAGGSRGVDPVLAEISDPGLCTLNDRRCVEKAQYRGANVPKKI